MPFARPSLADLWNRIGALYRATYPGADTNAKNSPDRALVGMIARSTDEDLSYLDWQARQLFPDTAETTFLERWANWKNLNRKAATFATGSVNFTGVTPGMTAEAGAQMQSSGGVVVTLTADCTGANDGTATAQVAAAVGGAAGNIGTGTVMDFIGTPAGFPDTGVAAANFAGGADAETDPQLRLRTKRAYSQPSFGGNQNDWQNAALGVAGVSRAYTAPATPTPGAVTIYPLLDALRNNGIPVGTDAWFRPGTGPSAGKGGDGDQLLVLNAVLATRPVCANVYVKAFATQALAITVTGLSTLSDAVKAAIATEIANMLVAKVAALDTPASPVAFGYTIYRSWISAAISQASGVKKFDLTIPAADVTVPAGTLEVPGVITYA